MKTTLRWIALALALTLVAAACGDDDGDGDDTSSDDSAGETTEDGAEGSGEDDSGDGGEGGGEQASGDPIPVGFVNIEGGPISLPEIRVGFEEAVAYVNAELGGVNGRPIEITASCNTDLTPESSVNCANQMIEEDVAVVFQGVDVAADAGLPLYKEAGLAQIVVFGVSPALNSAEGDVFAYIWASEEGLAASMRAQQTLGSEKIVLASADSAASRGYGETLIPELAEQVGIDVDVVYYPPDVDWATFAQTILASNPDGVTFPAITDQDCLGMVPAMKATGFDGPLHAGSCNLMLSVLDGPTLDGVITHAEYTWASMVNDDTSEEVRDQIATYEEYVGDANADYVGGFSTLGFALGVTGAEMLEAVEGEFTAESVRAGLPGATGTVFFSDVPFDCSGQAWPGSSSCRSGMIFTEIGADLMRTEFEWSPVDVSDLKPES